MLRAILLASAAFGPAHVCAQQVFSADAAIGGIDSEAAPQGNPGQVNTAVPEEDVLVRPGAKSIGTLPRVCGCGAVKTSIDTADIRGLSNTYAAGGGANDNSYGMSNMGALLSPTRHVAVLGAHLSSQVELSSLPSLVLALHMHRLFSRISTNDCP